LGGRAKLIHGRDVPVADLVADRGMAAETNDFFRSRAFYDAEGVSHTLRLEGRGVKLALPLLVREIEGWDLTDAVSPYGYPGVAVDEAESAPPDPGRVDWSATGLVSVFARDRLGGDPWLAGATKRSVVQVHDPSRERRVRTRFGEQIRRNARLGYHVEVLSGPETSAEQRSGFHAVYTETMDRAKSADRYFFGLDYLTGVLSFEDSWLLLCRSPERAVAAGAIAGLSDGLLHYYLGGTAAAHLEDSPFKNVADAMIGLADELGMPLNLGGGIRSGDGLENFKRGFANAELPFYTHEIVCDRDAYLRLSEGRADADYFPLYRAAG
jgi:hypothetical protein